MKQRLWVRRDSIWNRDCGFGVTARRGAEQVRRETEAFKALIEAKATMVVAEGQDGKSGEPETRNPNPAQQTLNPEP